MHRFLVVRPIDAIEAIIDEIRRPVDAEMSDTLNQINLLRESVSQNSFASLFSHTEREDISNTPSVQT